MDRWTIPSMPCRQISKYSHQAGEGEKIPHRKKLAATFTGWKLFHSLKAGKCSLSGGNYQNNRNFIWEKLEHTTLWFGIRCHFTTMQNTFIELLTIKVKLKIIWEEQFEKLFKRQLIVFIKGVYLRKL